MARSRSPECERNDPKDNPLSELIDGLTHLLETKNLFKAKLGLGDSVPFRDYVAALTTTEKAIATAKGWAIIL